MHTRSRAPPGQWEGPVRSQSAPPPAHFLAAPPGGLHALASWHLKIMSYFTCDSLSVVGSPCRQPAPQDGCQDHLPSCPWRGASSGRSWALLGDPGVSGSPGRPQLQGQPEGMGLAQFWQGFTLRSPSWRCATQGPACPSGSRPCLSGGSLAEAPAPRGEHSP